MRTRRTIFTGLLLCLALLAVYNVVADNQEVVALAETTACGAVKCSLATTKEMRLPYGQSFTFQTSLKPVKTVDVDCRRQLVLVGSYSCKKDAP